MNRRDFLSSMGVGGIMGALSGCSTILKDSEIPLKKYKNPSNPDGKGIPVVFLHGGGLNISSLTPVFDYFSKKGHPTFGEDNLPGHGIVPYSGGKVTMDELADMHHHNLRKWGVKEHIVVGHSTGGMIALKHSIDHKGIVTGMVLANTLDVYPGEYKLGFSFLFQVYLATSAPNFVSQEPFDFSEQMEGGAIYSRSVRYTDPKAVGAIMDAIKSYDVRTQIPSIGSPVLVARALDDVVMEPHGVELMAGRFQKADRVDLLGGQYWIMKKHIQVEEVIGPRYEFVLGKILK